MGSYEEEPRVDVSALYNDWRDQLIQDGFVVVKNVISPERAQHYLDGLFSWLETFPYGFKKDDRSTWGLTHLPGHIKSGMYHGYAVSHERFFWEARTEPKVVDAFAKIWGTDKLLVSFDGANLTLPAPDRAPLAAWPHVDQSPLRRGLQCVQGILNLAPNGPDDGGLVVLRGSSALNEQFFQQHGVEGGGSWGPADWYGFSDDNVAWFTSRGCQAVKVCAEPGDLVLWDSRTVHYNKLPESDAIRSVLYICYTPAAHASAEDVEKKKELFHNRVGTTHWPHANIFSGSEEPQRLGKTDTYKRTRPVQEPKETEQVLKLAGAMSY